MSRFTSARWKAIQLLTALAVCLAALNASRNISQGAEAATYTVFLPFVSRTTEPAIVFVSRQIPANGSIYWPQGTKAQPGVGPHARFRVAAPGKLMVREPDGALRTLVDGAHPSAASLNLIDVNAPDVSFDGSRIVFAGLPAGSYSSEPMNNPGAWRIYAINADGSGLRQVTTSSQNFSQAQLRAQFPPDPSGYYQAADRFFYEGYDDTDPAWLPDGRIVFSSTRWYATGQYSGVRASNLFVVNADGSGLHRITSERNGADRPTIDPLTGKIVYSRWWRNHRSPINSMSTLVESPGIYVQKDGLTADVDASIPAPNVMSLNFWQLDSINPDGTDLAMWTGAFRDEDVIHIYGGAFAPDGTLYANFFPMSNMTEASGFGGVRRYLRGPGQPLNLIGTTEWDFDYARSNPPSYGVGKGPFASEPAVLPDGRLVISWAPDYRQDYGLYTINADGSDRKLLYDNPGTTELRARPIAARSLPPIIPNRVTQIPSLLPPGPGESYAKDGTFVFDALNVYANAPVDWDIISAAPVGSAASIRFFLDHQRSSPGSFPGHDWPILLNELPIAPDGSVRESSAPANVPLFEQLRSSQSTGYLVPPTGGAYPNANGDDGAAHVAGMNFGRPGTEARCVGCHAGHTMIPVPANDADARFSNLAPGASIAVSSNSGTRKGLTDRRVAKGEIWDYWRSNSGQYSNQWARLSFPVPITVRTVRLYNPRFGDAANSSIQVNGATVKLCNDTACNTVVATRTVGVLSTSGTDVSFGDVQARAVRVEITSVSGTFGGARVASLAEIEVIARGEAGP